MNCLTHKYTHVHMDSAKGLFKITSGSQSLPSKVINRLLSWQHSNVALNIMAQLIFYVIELHLTTFLCTQRAHMHKHTWATPTHINRAQQPLKKKNEVSGETKEREKSDVCRWIASVKALSQNTTSKQHPFMTPCCLM